ncbi:hypothetical protein DSLASN_02600 [Desulfoluna limicola]|uniref:Phage tail protein n=1 Tax=Desulfoluna limicola TaxID=2810562 RepID=A0ABM7PBU5_9BACT|nr:tail protein X [Desulfoluna limicola]BCS94628.1 hypothetical protein DSLASN_02600 [Desulfoluna limicola]
MTQYRSKDGDVVDEVAFHYYGTLIGTVEAVLEANPGLADHGPVLSAGVLITLPKIQGPVAQEPVRLWD